jgi:hypothetical protein
MTPRLDKFDRAIRRLEREVMKIDGVEALVQGIYVPGRRGGDVAISINQGSSSGTMSPRTMSQFVGMLIANLIEYKAHLDRTEVH